MPSRARLTSLGLTEWYELGNAVVVTNDIANATITPEKFSNVFTSNIRENGDAVTGNIYFTNVRAIQALTGGNGIVIAANGLITADFSNAEITGDVDTDSVIASNAEITTNLYAVNQVTLGNVTILGTVDLLGVGLDSLNANIYANVIEGGSATIGDLTVTGNLVANLNITTDDVAEGTNLYFTNDRVIAVINDPSLTTTDNVAEGTNLYFTNTRAIGSLTAGDGIAIAANGLIVSTPNLSPSFNDLYVDGNLVVTGNLTYLNVTALEIDDNMIYLNANSTTAHPDLGWAGNYNDGTYRHAGIFRDATDGIFKFFDEYEPEPDASPFIDTANATFHLANVQATTFIGNVTGQVSDISNHDTDALSEGSNNLYFTNARAIASLTAGDGITIEANGLVIAEANAEPVFDDIVANTITVSNTTTNVLIVNGTGDSYLTGIANITAGSVFAELYGNVNANVVNGAELYVKDLGGNIYGLLTPVSQGGFDDLLIAGFPGHDIYMLPNDGTGRVYIDGDLEVVGNLTLNITTDSVAEGANLYFTNTRAIGALTAGDNIVIEANGLVIGEVQQFSGNTDVVPEGTANLYFTNARALAAVVDNITTDNVIEGGNLYFNNTRAIGSLTGGSGITIEANGLIVNSGVANTAVLLTSETFVGDGSNTDFTMGSSITAPQNILVVVNGVTQIPTTDYTVNATTLEFVTAPVEQANIEVRFFGDADNLIDARGYFSQSIDQASGYAVTSINGTALSTPLNKQYILHSIFVTNIDDSLSGNVAITASIDQYMGGSHDPNTNVYIANALPVDHRMSVELLKKPQILNAGDKVSMRALKDGVGANSNIHAYLVYETRSDVNYFGSGVNIGDLNNHILFDAGGNKATIENVRLANYGGAAAAATVRWTDSSNTTIAYFCYNFVVPVNTTVEILENPKLIPQNGRIVVSASAPNAIAVSVSGRKH